MFAVTASVDESSTLAVTADKFDKYLMLWEQTTVDHNVTATLLETALPRHWF